MITEFCAEVTSAIYFVGLIGTKEGAVGSFSIGGEMELRGSGHHSQCSGLAHCQVGGGQLGPVLQISGYIKQDAQRKLKEIVDPILYKYCWYLLYVVITVLEFALGFIDFLFYLLGLTLEGHVHGCDLLSCRRNLPTISGCLLNEGTSCWQNFMRQVHWCWQTRQLWSWGSWWALMWLTATCVLRWGSSVCNLCANAFSALLFTVKKVAHWQKISK